MSYIAFDYETSGLPNRYVDAKVTPETLSAYDTCLAVSLGAALFSEKGVVIRKFHAIIQPFCFEISEDVTNIHKITQDEAVKEGQPFPKVFCEFRKFIKRDTNTLVAHNAHFDENVFRSEILRHDLDMSFLDVLVIICILQN